MCPHDFEIAGITRADFALKIAVQDERQGGVFRAERVAGQGITLSDGTVGVAAVTGVSVTAPSVGRGVGLRGGCAVLPLSDPHARVAGTNKLAKMSCDTMSIW